jgi:4'-phosphopantetheinyl transferase
MSSIELPVPIPFPSAPPEGVVHLWKLDLDDPPLPLDELEEFVTGEERARAEKFYFPQHRRRCLAARALLRGLIGRYTGATPPRVPIRYGSEGKPFTDDLSFNLSHSGGHALLAVACTGQIGVDLETIIRERDTGRLARRFFSEAEKRALGGASEEDRPRLFHQFWVRKESWLKAAGRGLVAPLSQWDVADLSPSKPRITEGWWVYDLPADQHQTAAIALDRPVRDFSFFALSES